MYTILNIQSIVEYLADLEGNPSPKITGLFSILSSLRSPHP